MSDVTFTKVEYYDRYENNQDEARIRILDADDYGSQGGHESNDKKHHASKYGDIGGLYW